MKRIEISGNLSSKQWAEITNKLYGKVLVSYDGTNSNNVYSKVYDLEEYDETYLKSLGCKVKILDVDDHYSEYRKELCHTENEIELLTKRRDYLLIELEKYNIAKIDNIFHRKIGIDMNGNEQCKLYNDIKEYNTYDRKVYELLKMLHYKYEYKDKCLKILGK